MRILIDTNVLISLLYSKRGAAYALLRECLSGRISYVVSPLLALEYEGKITDKIEDGFLRVSKKDCDRILDAFFAGAFKPLLFPVILLPIFVEYPSKNLAILQLIA